jgi:deoxyribodipyrimidine photo-lyase
MQVDSYCHAGARQFGFMLRGLRQMEPKLKALNIAFFVVKGDPTQTIPKLVKDTKAALLVTDFAVLRDGRRWRDTVSHFPCQLVAVPYPAIMLPG